jgi:hypothetical protein
MDLNEFCQLVEHLRGLWLQAASKELAELRAQLELAERAKAFPPDVRAIFERYDRNRNGRLEHSELREALRAFGTKEGRGLEVPRRNPMWCWLQP